MVSLSIDISEELATLVPAHPQAAAGSEISGARHAQVGSAASSVEDVGAAFDGLIDRVKRLRQRTAEATLFLSAYDVRRAHEVCPTVWYIRTSVHRFVLFASISWATLYEVF